MPRWPQPRISSFISARNFSKSESLSAMMPPPCNSTGHYTVLEAQGPSRRAIWKLLGRSFAAERFSGREPLFLLLLTAGDWSCTGLVQRFFSSPEMGNAQLGKKLL